MDEASEVELHAPRRAVMVQRRERAEVEPQIDTPRPMTAQEARRDLHKVAASGLHECAGDGQHGPCPGADVVREVRGVGCHRGLDKERLILEAHRAMCPGDPDLSEQGDLEPEPPRCRRAPVMVAKRTHQERG